VVVDTSALLGILFGEPDRDRLIAALVDVDDPVVSAATLVEASIVMQARTGDDGIADLDELLATAGVRCVAVDLARTDVTAVLD
jgi:ribonuclease VapC